MLEDASRQLLRLYWLEVRSEVAHCGWLCDDPISREVRRVSRHLAAHRDDVVDVAPRVRASRDPMRASSGPRRIPP
jgi:hypothetical protein